MSALQLQLTIEAAVVFPDTGVAWSQLLCHGFWWLFLQSQKSFVSQEKEKSQDPMSTFRLHGCYNRCECMLVEPLLSLSKLPTGKNLIMNSGILSALWCYPENSRAYSGISFLFSFHQSHGPETHSLNLPGYIVGLKCPCAAGVKHLSLPVSSNHPSLRFSLQF